MSIEKCFALYFPLKARVLCTVSTAKWVSGITAVIYALYNSPLLVLVSVEDVHGSTECVVRQDYHLLNQHSFSMLYSFIPFVIIITMNSAIIVKLIKAKYSTKDTESTNQALNKVATRGTATLLIVSFTFIILMGLMAISELYVITDLNFYVILVLMLFSSLNHCINAVLYCIVGTRFRTEFFSALCYCGRRQ